MASTDPKVESDSDQRSIAAAYFAGVCQLIWMICFFREDYLSSTPFRLAVVNGWFYLMPLPVVIVGRRIVAITYTYALLLFLISMAEVLYLMSSFGALGFMSRWSQGLLGLVSLLLLLILVAGVSVNLIANALKRFKEKNLDG